MSGMANRVLIELDAILDTRLPTIARISPQAAADLVKMDEYYLRVTDDFEPLVGVTREAFQNAWKRRDVDTLKDSLMTEIPVLLIDLIKGLEQVEESTPFMQDLSIDLNIYPYKLSPEDQEELQKVVAIYCGERTLVKCVSLSPKDLRPSFIKPLYSGMIIYNFSEWVELHHEEFKKVRIPRVTVLAPALVKDKPPKPEDYLEKGMREDLTVFTLAEVGFLEYFAAQFLSARCFSIVRPDIFKQAIDEIELKKTAKDIVDAQRELAEQKERETAQKAESQS